MFSYNCSVYVVAMKLLKKYAIFLCIPMMLGTCNVKKGKDQPLFKILTPEQSGIEFMNNLYENDSINFSKYRYIYSGGGVAIGDINNDGLQDIFFTGNMVKNKLYLNQGDLKFKDITLNAGVGGKNQWHSGVTMADVNDDGFLDIYVSVAGYIYADHTNKLYINNHDLTFTEEAKVRGLADNDHNYQATFFDYDQDGDLDVYTINYPFARFYSNSQFYRNRMDSIKENETDHLFQNDGKGFYQNVTKKAGLLSYGQSLGVCVGDFNQDSRYDLYISNDFSPPDYYYTNNGDGTFGESLQESFKHTALFGMGADVADFNNDGLLDLMQLDMRPEDNYRRKANLVYMPYKMFQENVKLGFHYQYMQNILQLNQGIMTNGLNAFSDIANLAGVTSTDWSWGPLFMDMDNDGWKDIFIATGIRRDINNNDFFKLLTKPSFRARYSSILQIIRDIPSEKIPNFAFRNNADLTFSEMSSSWGLDFTGFSNGAAYGDLDNDGDLDIVVNNIDSVAMLFENRAEELSRNNYIRFKLDGPAGNRFGLGTKIQLEYQGQKQFQELTLTRGFQSSVEPIIHFGTGNSDVIQKVIITWSDGRQQILNSVSTNQLLCIQYSNSDLKREKQSSDRLTWFTEVNDRKDLKYRHMENEFDDFQYEPLLPHKNSRFGPGLAAGDIDGNGLDDFYIGGAANSKGKMFVQQKDGQFSTLNGPWENDSSYEDTGAVFFDANGDGALDLYIVSGGNEFLPNSTSLQDRLYINSGNGNFIRATKALPEMLTSGLCVVPSDYDGDGDYDLFVGGRIIPRKYPYPPRSYLLENISENGVPRFVDITEKEAPDLVSPGMVTSATWIDFDSDGDEDLVVSGEWMPISFYQNDRGIFSNVTKAYGFENATGWWNCIVAEDFDGDGDEDLVAGNLGLNYNYKANEMESFDIFAKDFDNDGSTEIVLAYYYNGVQYPVRERISSTEQMPSLRYKFRSYGDFARATLTDVYPKSALSVALHYQAKNFASCYFENLGNKRFAMSKLPNQAQISSINDLITGDFNHDGLTDILAIGNVFSSEVEIPRNDAFYGLVLTGDGHGSFLPVPFSKSGFFVPNDARSIIRINTSNGHLILVANNDDSLQVFNVNNASTPSSSPIF